MKVSNVPQFRKELDALIMRWEQESDITVAELLGELDIVKTTHLLRIHAPGIKMLAQGIDPDKPDK